MLVFFDGAGSQYTPTFDTQVQHQSRFGNVLLIHRPSIVTGLAAGFGRTRMAECWTALSAGHCHQGTGSKSWSLIQKAGVPLFAVSVTLSLTFEGDESSTWASTRTRVLAVRCPRKPSHFSGPVCFSSLMRHGGAFLSTSRSPVFR
ncbi:hypothetical protein SR39_25065 [Methylobacterium radiotolerans]|nr:hypothetical protein SR39_25065 [Methylobacterium radiotolerans]